MSAESPATPHRYRRWNGSLSQGRWTWLAIVTTGIRLAFKSVRTRALLIGASGVVLGGSIVLYLFSLLEAVAGTRQAAAILEFVRGLLQVDLSDVTRIGEFREILWRVLFLLLIKVEMFLVLLTVASVGPGLISNDLKHRALPIYFAKPVTPITYLAGKWLVVSTFIAAVTLIPNLLTLVMGVAIGGGLHTWGQTLGLATDLLISGLAVCTVGSAIMVALSSLTSDQRYVAVAWLAVCLLPTIAQGIVNDALPADATTGWLGCISLRGDVVVVTDWLFSTREALQASSLPAEAFTDALVSPVKPGYAAAALAAWTVVGLLVSYRRIVKFSRSAANV